MHILPLCSFVSFTFGSQIRRWAFLQVSVFILSWLQTDKKSKSLRTPPLEMNYLFNVLVENASKHRTAFETARGSLGGVERAQCPNPRVDPGFRTTVPLPIEPIIRLSDCRLSDCPIIRLPIILRDTVKKAMRSKTYLPSAFRESRGPGDFTACEFHAFIFINVPLLSRDSLSKEKAGPRAQRYVFLPGTSRAHCNT